MPQGTHLHQILHLILPNTPTLYFQYEMQLTVGEFLEIVQEVNRFPTNIGNHFKLPAISLDLTLRPNRGYELEDVRRVIQRRYEPVGNQVATRPCPVKLVQIQRLRTVLPLIVVIIRLVQVRVGMVFDWNRPGIPCRKMKGGTLFSQYSPPLFAVP
jgi:hypothetical protein